MNTNAPEVARSTPTDLMSNENIIEELAVL
jgi:hypothetical protein